MASLNISYLGALFVIVFSCKSSVQTSGSSHPILLLVSLDGFRYDYLEKFKDVLPTLRQLAADGTHVEYVRNVFPTATFPNHYSIVTGLYPESHGIVGNDMYDPVFDEHFNMTTTDSKWWEGAEPIWVSNQRQGFHSGMGFWPGYDVNIKGILPFYRPMNESLGKPFAEVENLMPWLERVDLVVEWLNRSSEEAPSFVTLYFEEPDEAGHGFGVDSPEIKSKIKELDQVIKYLMEKLRKLDNFHDINIIITADHGMSNYNASTVVNIDQYVNPDSFVFWTPGSSRFLLTNSSTTTVDELYSNFKDAEKGTGGKIKVFRKSEIPERFHYRNNRRIPDIVGFAEIGYLMNTSKFVNWTMSHNITKGAHGYDPIHREMSPLLIAYGPAFNQHYKSGPVELVDLYSLMCHVIGIKPQPNNGTFTRIAHLLRTPPHTGISRRTVIIAVVIGSIIVIGLCTFLIYKMKRKFRGKSPSILFRNPKSEWNYPLMGSEGEEDDIVIF